MGIRRRDTLILGGSLVALGGCHSTAGSADEPARGMEPEVDALLDRRSAALAAGDEPGWLAAVDAGNPALVAHEKQVLANLRQLRVDGGRFRRCGRAPDPARPGRYASSLPRESTAYDVDLAMRLPGADSAPTAVRYRCVFGRVDGAVVLVDVAGAPAAGGEPAPLTDCPWDTGALRVRRRPDLLLAAQSGVADPDALLEVAARAAAEIRRDWGDNPLPDAFAVFVAGDSATFRGWFAGAAPDWSAGVTVPVRGAESTAAGTGRFVGSRIAVDLATSRSTGSPYETIKRQLAYAAALAVLPASPRPAGLPGAAEFAAPLWAVEGFAQYLAGRDSAAVRARSALRLRAARRLTGAPELAGNRDFYSAANRAANAALGCSVFQFVAGRYGHERARSLYLAAVTHGQAAGPIPTPASTTRPEPASATRPQPASTATPGPASTARRGPVSAARPDPTRAAQPASAPSAALAAALARAGLADGGRADATATDFYTQWRRFVERS
ncbi:hypothetical protein ACFFWC_13445 [Plantactinospora siamensis]|uniref:Uncharacterized protein n=1 Tax=Plantactinospora siamensis TaxID=555372 RepID=A0ABV6P2C2_9ACTN